MKRQLSLAIIFFILAGLFPSAQVNALSESECINLGGGCEATPCGSNPNLGSCSVPGEPFCCGTATAPPPPPGSTGPVPDTNCPADATYVALTDSCISVGEFNNFLFNLLILAGVLVAIFRATTGFFMFLTAEGSPDKLQSGREALTQAMVGLVIVVSGYVLIRLFEQILPTVWNVVLTGA